MLTQALSNMSLLYHRGPGIGWSFQMSEHIGKLLDILRPNLKNYPKFVMRVCPLRETYIPPHPSEYEL